MAMITSVDQDIIQSLLSLDRDERLVRSFVIDQDLDEYELAWEAVQQKIQIHMGAGTLSSVTRKVAYTVAQRLKVRIELAVALEAKQTEDLDTLAATLEDLSVTAQASSVRQRCCKRDWRPPSPSPSLGGKSPNPSCCSTENNSGSFETPLSPIHTVQNTNPTDHIRLWFLSHLSKPYPTAVEKESLASLTGILRNKIDSDMTNWRRRAGWTEIKDTWAGGDKNDMKILIENVEMGKEKRKSVREAVERMKAYLERREEERVGDWVYELTSLAKQVKKTKTKKPRLMKNERPITPPSSAKCTPESSDAGSSSSRSNSITVPAASKQSPSLSLRSSSISSLSSFTSSPGGFQFNFQPYPSGSNSNSYFPSTTLAVSSLNAGQKRAASVDMAISHPSTKPKFELAPSPMTRTEGVHGLPQWLPGSSYTLIPDPQHSDTTDGNQSMWSTTQQLPSLPHMIRSNSAFVMPSQWEFQPTVTWQ